MTNYTLSDFRKNLKEHGLQQAFAEDAKATRERHPIMAEAHDTSSQPCKAFKTLSDTEKNPTLKGMYWDGVLLGAAIYPILFPVACAIYSADRINKKYE